MRLHLDAQALQGPFYERGIARYIAALIRALRATDAPIAGIGLHPNEPDVAPLYADIAADPVAARTTASRWRELIAAGPLVHVCMSAFEGLRPVQNLWPPFVLDSDVPLAAIVYDTIPLRYPEQFQDSRERRGFYAARARLLAHADRFLVISRSSGRDLVEDLGVHAGKVRCIGTGVDARFHAAEDRSGARASVRHAFPAIARPYVLDVAGWPVTKNVLGLLRAWAQLSPQLRRNTQLVLACRVPTETGTQWRNAMHELAISPDEVVITGFVRDDVLVALYQAAELLVCPSLHEGFGLPVAEAAACGCPAISSNTSSLPEVLDFPDATFDPRRPDDIAAAVTRALEDTAFRRELTRAGREAAERHRWDVVANRFLDGMEGLAVGANVRQPRFRSAVLAPTGHNRDDAISAADVWSVASAELARLGGPGAAIVDVFGPRRARSQPDPEPGIRRFPRQAFARVLPAAAYDHVVTMAT